MCPVVDDLVGKDTWDTSLKCLRRGGILAYSAISGPILRRSDGILGDKGSLFLTRPSLNTTRRRADPPGDRK